MKKKKSADRQPTRTEVGILGVLWDKGPSTVRDVHEALNETGRSGYTTALKMLQVMHQKGLVARDGSQRAHVYSAAVSKERTQSEFLADLVERLFDGSTSKLVMRALFMQAPASESTGNDELARIHKLITQAGIE